MTVTVERAETTFADLCERIESESVEETLQRVAEIEARRRVDAAQEAVALAKLERVKAYQRDGHASMHGVLRSRLGWSEGECRQRMQIARLVAEHRGVGEVLFEAQASLANVAAIARAHANPRCGDRIGEVLGTLLTEACRMEHDDFRRLPARWELLARRRRRPP